MNPTKFPARLALLIAATGLTSCNSTPPTVHTGGPTDSPAVQSASTDLPTTGPVATTRPDDLRRHWVQNDQLRNLMKDLSARAEHDWPRDIPQDPEDPQTASLRTSLASAIKLSDELAIAALRIPAGITDAKLSEADRAGFEAEANTLHTQALQLGTAARAKKVEQMQKSLEAINATCISCHSRYRDISGLLQIHQASAE